MKRLFPARMVPAWIPGISSSPRRVGWWRLGTTGRGMLAAVALAVGTPQGLACATCFGRSDSAMAQGMNSGILFLLGVVGFVLAGLLAGMALFAVRSNRLARAQAAVGALDEEPPGNGTGGPLLLVASEGPGLLTSRSPRATARQTCWSGGRYQ